MTTPVDIVRGNDFPLNTHISVWDDNLDAYVSYDMTGATDIHVWLVRDREMSERLPLRISAVNTSVVTAMVPGKLVRPETYGVEIAWTSPEHRAKRAYRRTLLNFQNCNDEPASEPEDVCPATTDVQIHINVDVNSVDIGMATVPVPADWNQNDSDRPDYVKHRTHWTETSAVRARLAWRSDVVGNEGFYLHGTDLSFDGGALTVGDTTIRLRYSMPTSPTEQDLAVFTGLGTMNVTGFANPTSGRIVAEQPIDLGFDILVENVHKLDNKYIDMDPVPTPGSGKPVTSEGVFVELEDMVRVGDELGVLTPPGVDFNAYADTVWNKEQTLSQAQKDQVKANLGIASDENLSNLELIALLGL